MGCKWSNQYNKSLQHLLVLTLLLAQLVHADHEGRDRCVIAECLDIGRYFLDKLVYALQVLGCSSALVESILEEVPELLQEAVTAIDTVGIPRFTLLNRTQEHFVKTQGVGTILLYNHIGINHIEHRLRHLFDSPTTDVFAIFEDELSIVIIWAPSLKGLNIQNISRYDIYIYVDRSGFLIVASQVQAYELTLIGTLVLDTIYEVRTTLNHTLVNQLLEWLVLAAVT